MSITQIFPGLGFTLFSQDYQETVQKSASKLLNHLNFTNPAQSVLIPRLLFRTCFTKISTGEAGLGQHPNHVAHKFQQFHSFGAEYRRSKVQQLVSKITADALYLAYNACLLRKQNPCQSTIWKLSTFLCKFTMHNVFQVKSVERPSHQMNTAKNNPITFWEKKTLNRHLDEKSNEKF